MESYPTLADGRYVVKRCIGRGGMAAVFLVYDNTFEVDRAIKVLDPALVVRSTTEARFRTEAQAMARLNHPHIVRVYDYGMEAMTSYIVMDYLPHGSLQGYLESDGPLDREVAIGVALDVAKALVHAHEAGIIHRDIKPDNILLSPNGVLLTDFGLARISELCDGKTRAGVMMGTPLYMSPEQRLSAKNVDHLTDIYALTATLFTLLTFRDPIDLYDEELQDELLEGLDEGLAALIRQGCHADQAQRFATAKALIDALEAVREAPGSPRLSIPTLPEVVAKSNSDLIGLKRIWDSYTNPSADDHSLEPNRTSETMMFSQLEHSVAAPRVPAEPTANPAETQAADALETPPLMPERPVPTEPSRPLTPPKESADGLGVRLGVLALLALAMVGVFAAWQVYFTEPAPFTLTSTQDAQAVSTYEKARQHLLLGSPRRASEQLSGLMDAFPDDRSIVLLYGMAAFCQGQDTAAHDAFARALKQSGQRTDRVSHVLRNDGALPDSAGEENETRESLPELDILQLILTWSSVDAVERMGRINAARALHPKAAVFALLGIRHQREAVRTVSERARLMESVASSLTAFPGTPGLLMERGRLLYEMGQHSAAEEALSAVLRHDANHHVARHLLADLGAMAGEEHKRSRAMISNMGDSVSWDGQRVFLHHHGVLLIGLGRPDEARKIWDYADNHRPDEGAPPRDMFDVADLLHAKQRVYLDQDDKWRAMLTRLTDDLAQQKLPKDSRRVLEAKVLFMEGMAAHRAGNRALAEQRLKSLTDRAEVDPGETRRFGERLAFELQLASDIVAAKDSVGRFDAGREPCRAQWADARVTAALAQGGFENHLARLGALSEALQTGDCMLQPAVTAPLRAEVHLLLAETALAAGDLIMAKQGTDRFDAVWPESEQALPFDSRIARVRAAFSEDD